MYSFGQIRELLRSVGFPENVLDTMAALVFSESGGDPNVQRTCPGNGLCYITRNGRMTIERAVPGQSPENSVGLLQINLRAHPQYSAAALRDPVANAQAALQIYQKQGLKAWGSYSNGAFKKYLPGGAADPGTGAVSAADFATGGFGAGSIITNLLSGWLQRPVMSADERFRPYLQSPGLTGTTRFQVAALIAIVVIAFAWREL